MIDRDWHRKTEMLFLEYKEKWAYIRHVEQIQNLSIQGYVLIVGGVLTFIFRELRENTIYDYIHKSIYVFPFTFLVLYSIFIQLLLVHTKRNYDVYVNRIWTIENICYNIERKSVRQTYGINRVFRSFRLRYALVALLGSVPVMLLILALTGSACIGGVAATVYLVVSIGVTFLRHFPYAE